MSSATDKTVTVSFDPNAVNIQTDFIFGATTSTAGAMTAAQVQLLNQLAALVTANAGPKIFSNLTRPAPNDPMFDAAFADGRVGEIWNSDDKAPNYTDGTNWYNATGQVTTQ